MSTHQLQSDLIYDLSIKDSFQTLDLYLPLIPTQPPSPILIYVHGGAWRSGDKSEGTNQVLINHLTARFPSSAIATVNYRLSLPGTNQVKHPDHNQDVTHAIDYLLSIRTPSAAYDQKKAYLFGHSVGAFIILSISGILSSPTPSPSIKNPEAILGLGLIDGIYGLKELLNEYPGYSDFVQGAIGSNGSPFDYDQISPLHWNLNPSSQSTKILIIHSPDDTLLSPQQSKLFIDHLHQLNTRTLSIQIDLQSVRGDHDPLLASDALTDRISNWIQS